MALGFGHRWVFGTLASLALCLGALGRAAEPLKQQNQPRQSRARVGQMRCSTEPTMNPVIDAGDQVKEHGFFLPPREDGTVYLSESGDVNFRLSGTLLRLVGTTESIPHSTESQEQLALKRNDIKLTGILKSDVEAVSKHIASSFEVAARLSNDVDFLDDEENLHPSDFDPTTFVKELYAQANDLGGVKGLVLRVGGFEQHYGLRFKNLGEYGLSRVHGEEPARRLGAGVSYKVGHPIVDTVEASAFQSSRGIVDGFYGIDSFAGRVKTSALPTPDGGSVTGQLSGIHYGNSVDDTDHLKPVTEFSAGVTYKSKDAKTLAWAELLYGDLPAFRGDQFGGTVGVQRRLARGLDGSLSFTQYGGQQYMAGIQAKISRHCALAANISHFRPHEDERGREAERETIGAMVLSVHPWEKNGETIFHAPAK